MRAVLAAGPAPTTMQDVHPAVQEARVLRWRSIPKRWTFVDVSLADSGEELQLCFAAAELSVALAEGALLRFTGTEEPQRTRRGVRAYQCDKLLQLTPPVVSCLPCLPCEPAPSESSTLRDALCKHFVRGGCSERGCPFRHAFANEHEEETVRTARERWAAQRRAHEDADDPFLGGEGGGKSAHAQRHAEFAAWLLETFGAEALQRNAGVVDVGGGGGELSFELHCRRGVRTTLLEPREVRLNAGQRRFLRKLPRSQGSERNEEGERSEEGEEGQTRQGSDGGHGAQGAYRHVRALLDDHFEASAEGGALLRGASCLVGLHPDEATELIVNAALKYGRPFAVVPCCVFPRLFPHRPQVRTTAAFCDYLLRKGCGLEVGFLPVQGRNKVIFRRAAAPPQPEHTLAHAADSYMPQSVLRADTRFGAGSTAEDHGQAEGAAESVERGAAP